MKLDDNYYDDYSDDYYDSLSIESRSALTFVVDAGNVIELYQFFQLSISEVNLIDICMQASYGSSILTPRDQIWARVFLSGRRMMHLLTSLIGRV